MPSRFDGRLEAAERHHQSRLVRQNFFLNYMYQGRRIRGHAGKRSMFR